MASAIGYLMALTGLAYLVQGFVVGSVGFDPRNDIPTLAGYASWLIWSIWFLVASWRKRA